MDIAMVTPRFVNDIRGGGEVSCKLLVDTLRKLGIEVDVISGDELFPEIQNTIKLNLSMYMYLRKQDLSNYDIIHTYNMSLLPTIGKLTKEQNLNSVGTLNGHVFSPTFEKRFSNNPLRVSAVASLMLKTEIVHIKRFTVLGECWRQIWIKDGIPADKIQVIQNMIPENYKPVNVKKGKTVNILIVGNTAIWRNVKLILDTYACLPKQDIKLTLVGIGWEAIVANYKGENNFVYRGHVSQQELNYLYALADIYVQAFEYTGAGRSMLEAALNKTALVSNGTEKDYGELSKAISFFDESYHLGYQLQALIDDKKERNKLGKLAEKIVNAEFTPIATAKKHIKNYKELLND